MPTWIIVTFAILAVCVVTLGGLLVVGGAYFRAVAAGRTRGEALARERLTEVAAALARYKARAGDYPSRLEQLVPDFLPEIPETKPGTQIGYVYRPDDPLLYYSAFIYYRRILHVATGQWSAQD